MNVKSKKKYPNDDMRLMNNRGKHDPTKLIFLFLEKNTPATLSKIDKYLGQCGIKHSKAAIGNLLKKLEGKKIKNISKNKYPKYEIIDTSEFKIQSDAYAFKDQIWHNGLHMHVNETDMNMIKPYSDKRKKRMVDMILKLGLMSFYTYLNSYERGISPKFDNDKNKELHNLWLRNALSFENNIQFGRPSKWIQLMIDKNLTKQSTPNRIKESKKLKQIFSEMFPDWYYFFQSDEKSIDNMHEMLRDVCVKHPEYLLE